MSNDDLELRAFQAAFRREIASGMHRNVLGDGGGGPSKTAAPKFDWMSAANAAGGVLSNVLSNYAGGPFKKAEPPKPLPLPKPKTSPWIYAAAAVGALGILGLIVALVRRK